MFLWFFMISVALCRCLHIWSSHLFQTLVSLVGGTLEHAVTPNLVLKCTKLEEIVVPTSLEGHDVLLAQATGVHNIDTCVEFGENSGSLQWLQELLESSSVPLGPAARAHGKEWWWEIGRIHTLSHRNPMQWQGSDAHRSVVLRAMARSKNQGQIQFTPVAVGCHHRRLMTRVGLGKCRG